MRLFQKIKEFLKKKPDLRQTKQESLSTHFQFILTTEKTPLNSSLNDEDFIQVTYKNEPYWLLFKCPCGCGVVISLPLQRIHEPYWILYKSKNNRPTVYPSVWQKDGCRSHFWIKDGAIDWCYGSGAKPSLENK